MTTIAIAIIIFLQLVQYFVFFDVIISWLSLAGIRFRPKFVSDILDPLYGFVRKYIPTKIGLFDLTPIIVLFGTLILMNLIFGVSPEAYTTLSRYL